MEMTTTSRNERKVSYNPFASGPLLLALPTTESQREIWSTIVLNEEATLCYNESLVLELKGQVDAELLNCAFQEVLKRHDALRCFFSGDGKSFFIGDFQPNPLKRLKLTNQNELEELKKAEVTQKFDLQNGPCIRGILAQFNDSLSYLILTAHHLVCDGWSFAVILHEISSYYELLKAGKGLPPVSPNQFGDHAMEEATKGGDPLHRAYWLNEFSRPVQQRPLPLDYPRPAYRTYESERIDLTLPEHLTRDLKAFAAKEGMSLYALLTGVYVVLYHKISTSPEVVTGMATASQSVTGKWELVGHLVNILPLRLKPHWQGSFRELLSLVRTRMLDAIDHQSYGLGTLIRELNLKRDPAEIPLLNTVFNIDQQSPGQGLAFKEIQGAYTTTPRIKENFELFFNIVSCEEFLSIECQYNRNLFKAETIQNWLNAYKELAEHLISGPHLSLEEIKLNNLLIPQASKVVSPGKQKEIERNFQREDELAEVWKHVLHLDEIKAEENFFSLGGHSLLAVELVSRIKERLQVPFSVRDVFEFPTVMEMAALVGRREGKEQAKLIIPRSNASSGVLSRNQLQVWYLEELSPGTIMHNLPAALRLRFSVDSTVMENALKLLIERHDAFRTVIRKERGEPVQVIQDFSQLNFSLPVVETTEEKVTDLLHQEAHHPLDKEQAPLIRAKLFRLGPSDYVFFFMSHHAIWDGWSFDIFFEELDTAYSALAQNKSPEFRGQPQVRYLDYAIWMDEEIKRGGLDHQLAYWKNKLAAPLPVLELPTDFKRPLEVNHNGAAVPFTLSQSLSNSLREYARQQSTSLFNVLLAAFKVTLARYSGNKDVVVGSPVRARNDAQLFSTIGYFVNTVALRTQLNLELSFDEIQRQVAETCKDGFAHQDLPFQVVLNEITYPRDASRTPVFQAFFSYQDVSNRGSCLNGHRYEQINVDKASVHTDLDLWIKAGASKIEGAFEYRTDLFQRISIERFMECFLYLLEQLPQVSTKPVHHLCVLPQQQQELVLKEWNNSYSDPSQFKPFIQHFEEMAQTYPHKLAVENFRGQLTYNQLDAQANRCAQGLIRAGVRPNDLVGISLNRDLNLLVGILGILKAGAGYVPLDPAFPQDRLDYMVESSSPRVLLTEKKLASRFAAPTLMVEDLLADLSLSDSAPNLTYNLEAPMYVIYTSGSTGKPKGVQVSHRAMINFLTSVGKKPGLTSEDNLLAVTTISFDIAALELYLPLMKGASLYLAANFDVVDGDALKNIIQEKFISCMQATPSTWRLLLAAGWHVPRDFKVLCGGEPFPLDLAHKLSSQCNSVWNMYGPTETTVWSTCKEVKADCDKVTLGEPLDNTYVYVLDENQQLCPVGAVGELYIGGLGLADGYFGRADLTSERFVPNPYRPGEKMYATGDFVRFLFDGDIECLGRKDGQVKVRGYRIELGEIEAAMGKIPGISENAVVTVEVEPEDVRIIGFYSGESELKEGDLREALTKVLPKYMVPSHFVFLSELPKTLNGKIEKKALPAQFRPKGSSSRNPVVEHVSTTSSELFEIWSEVLGTRDFPRDKNFFDIGGNSLLAVQMISKITQRLGRELPLATLIRCPSFNEFSREVGVGHTQNKLPELPQVFQSLVAIKAQGAQSPLFCFHGVGGNVLNYVTLAPFTKARPLIALQSRGANSGEFLDSIELMAREYVKEIKLVQPHGPYCLAGGSMGGMVALEVAIQLKQMGEKVERLIMFDTFGPDVDIRSYDRSERSFWKNLKISLYYRRRCFTNALKIKLLKTLGLPVPLEIRLFELEMNNYRALWKYQPSVYTGDLDLIRGKMRTKGWYSDPYMGWQRTITGDIRTYEIKGSHGDFIESSELGPVLEKLL